MNKRNDFFSFNSALFGKFLSYCFLQQHHESLMARRQTRLSLSRLANLVLELLTTLL